MPKSQRYTEGFFVSDAQPDGHARMGGFRGVSVRTIVGDLPQIHRDELEPLHQSMDSVVLALRTFKNGAVGYDSMHFSGTRFSPAVRVRTARTFGAEYIPIGLYELADARAEFLEYATHMRRGLHPALEVACSRLAAASIRSVPSDKLIDAVIGLEAILLSAIGGRAEYRGELRFRFALN